MVCTPYVDGGQGRVTVCTAATRPTGMNRYEGKLIYETDTDRLYVYDGAAWQLIGWASTAARVSARVSRVANQAIGTGATATISWDTETADTNGFIAVTATTLTIPSELGGIYAVSGQIAASAGMSGGGSCTMTAGGTSYSVYATANNAGFSFGYTLALAAAATISVSVYNGHSGSLNFTGSLQLFRLGV